MQSVVQAKRATKQFSKDKDEERCDYLESKYHILIKGAIKDDLFCASKEKQKAFNGILDLLGSQIALLGCDTLTRAFKLKIYMRILLSKLRGSIFLFLILTSLNFTKKEKIKILPKFTIFKNVNFIIWRL